MKQHILPGTLSKKQLTDAGMALALIFLILGLITKNDLFYKLAIPVLILDMIAPVLFYPFAYFWYSLSNVLGLVVPKILLTAIYVGLVLPIGLLRRLLGNDNLLLRKFKKERVTVMRNREYTFSKKDVESPY